MYVRFISLGEFFSELDVSCMIGSNLFRLGKHFVYHSVSFVILRVGCNQTKLIALGTLPNQTELNRTMRGIAHAWYYPCLTVGIYSNLVQAHDTISTSCLLKKFYVLEQLVCIVSLINFVSH